MGGWGFGRLGGGYFYGFRSSENFTDCGGFCALSHAEVLWQCDVELMACRRPLSVLVNMIKCGAGRGKGTIPLSGETLPGASKGGVAARKPLEA